MLLAPSCHYKKSAPKKALKSVEHSKSRQEKGKLEKSAVSLPHRENANAEKGCKKIQIRNVIQQQHRSHPLPNLDIGALVRRLL